MKWISVLTLFIGLHTAQAAPARVVIIPEAEAAKGSDHLSTRGERRAEALASLLQTNRAVLNGTQASVLFAPRSNNFSFETIQPFSAVTGLQIQQAFGANQSTPLSRILLQNRSFQGETVVLSWPRNKIPQLLSALGVRNVPQNIRTDRIYTVTFTQRGATLRQFSQHLMPGDSA